MKMRRIVFYLLVISSVNGTHQGAQYLNKAVRDLRQLNIYQTLRRADVDMLSSNPNVERPAYKQNFEVRKDAKPNENVPPLSLTKSELAALYEKAVAKGEVVKLATGDNEYIQAAVHEIEETTPNTQDADASTSSENGYYYYYYSLKSFLDELTSPTGTQESESHKHTEEIKHPKYISTTYRPPYTYHSHHHQHNITISNTAVEEKKPSKSLEPLFMAISGFIGMAVMFLFSVVVMPKLNTKPNNPKKSVWLQDDDIDNISRLALRAIDRESCTERFACELSQSARAFGLQNNRFVKLFRRLAPNVFRRHASPSAKYKYKEIECTAIPCRKKNNNGNNNNNSKNNPNRNNNRKKVARKNAKQKKS